LKIGRVQEAYRLAAQVLDTGTSSFPMALRALARQERSASIVSDQVGLRLPLAQRAVAGWFPQ